jgi:amino acid transporter
VPVRARVVARETRVARSSSPPVAFWQALILGICTMQVGPGIAIAAGYQLHVSGRQSWFVMACAASLATLVASAIALLAKYVVSTGSILAYVRLSLPRWAIMLTAATLLLGYVLGPASNVLGSAMYLASVLIGLGLPNAGSPAGISVLVLILTAIGCYCAYRGVELSAKAVLLLGVACIPVAIIITVAAAATYGFDVRPELSFAHARGIDLSWGIFSALGFFIGFDGVTSIASETAEPKRNVPRVLYWSLTIPGVATALAALFQTPVLLTQIPAIDAGASPSAVLARTAGIPHLDVISDVLLCLATIAGQIGWLNFSATIIATAARDGFLPRGLAKLHPRHATPFNAALFLSVVSVLISAALESISRVPAIVAVLYTTNMLVLLWLIPYILVCCAAVVVERRNGRPLSGTSIAAALGAAAISALLAVVVVRPMDAVARSTNWFTAALVICSFCAFYLTHRGSPRLPLAEPRG